MGEGGQVDREWVQTQDGQWVPVNNPRGGSGISRQTWVALGVAVLAFVLLVTALSLPVILAGGSVEPSAEERTRDALDELWLGYSTAERLDFCTEARAAGYEVVANEIGNVRISDPQEVRWWLEDRCG